MPCFPIPSKENITSRNARCLFLGESLSIPLNLLIPIQTCGEVQKLAYVEPQFPTYIIETNQEVLTAERVVKDHFSTKGCSTKNITLPTLQKLFKRTL